jgi:hypothetical protein
MLNKTTIILFILLISSVSLALDPKVISITTPEIIYGQPSTIQVNIDANDTTGNINMYDQNTIIDQKTYNPGDTQISFIRTFTELGEKNLKFSLTNVTPSDDNFFNSEKTTTINIKKGYDFTPITLTTDSNNYLAGQTITIQTFVTNEGDKDYTSGLDVFFFYDGNELGYKTINGLNLDETKIAEFEYTLPLDFDGEKNLLVQVNRTNAIQEFDITNNSKTLTISEKSIPNLTFESFSFEGSKIKAGETKTFKLIVSNRGGTIAENVLIRVFKTSISSETEVHEVTLNSLNSNSEQEINFNYSFLRSGEDKFVAYIDPLNTINESNDNDNVIELDYVVEDSNFVLDYSEFITTLEKLQGELNSCQSDLEKIRLEKDVVLENSASLETERNQCQSNLNTCNGNLTAGINEIRSEYNNQASLLDSNLVQAQSYFSQQLLEKDKDIKDLKNEHEKEIASLAEQSLFGWAVAIILILVIILPKVIELRTKRNSRMGGGIDG